MPIEKPVIHYPLAVDWRPPSSIQYRVKGSNDKKDPKRDTWISVARQHNLDVKQLI
jgi:hypothetical protein